MPRILYLTSCVVKQIRLQRFGARRRLWDGTIALQNINPPSPPASHFFIVINTQKKASRTVQRGHTCWFCIKSFLKRRNRAGKACFDPFHS